MQREGERLALAGVTALAAVLLLPGLGEQYLWQDEAQTAVIARTILSHGVPLGHDGLNFFSQELGREYGEGYLWKWHTWLSFYLVAGFLALLGESTFAARLPFALLGVATVALTIRAGRDLFRDARAGTAAGMLLALCVPFLVLSRQCRYHALAGFLSLLGLWAYARLEGGRRATLLLIASAALLFHAHYVYCATLLASLLLHAVLFERARLARALAATGAVFAINLPWIVWLSDVRPGGEAYWASVLDPAKALRFSADYARLALGWLLPAWLLLGLPLLALLRRRARVPPFRIAAETRSAAFLLVLFCAVTVVGLAVLSPLLFFRYLAPLAAPLALLGGALLAALWRHSRWLAVAALVLWALTGDLRHYLHELTHPYAGPMEGLVAFLASHAREGDTVAISYGDMPLKFYTRHRVVGGLTGEDLAPAKEAEWIVPRRHVNTEEDRRVRSRLLAIAREGGYQPIVLDVPDTGFENREDPRVHRFRSAGREVPRLRVFRKPR